MKTKIVYLALLLALILTGGQLYILGHKQNAKQEPATAEHAVLYNIMTRASVRQYQDKPVEQNKIEQLLRAGMAAPSAVDRRPWHLVVVTSKDKLRQLSQANPNGSYAKDAPLAIIVCGNMDRALEGRARDYWIQDCSAVSENILLAAHGMGLGAVWTGLYPLEERCDAVSKALGLGPDLIPLNAIIIGYPRQAVSPKDKWNADDVTYL